MWIRNLTGEDAAVFRSLRLAALDRNPEAFLSTAEEERRTGLEEIRSRLEQSVPDRFVLGAFEEGLVGMIGFARERASKLRHKATIWGMYVAPNARGRGIGSKLLDGTLARARALEGLRQVQLGVTSANRRAVGLYESRGFRPFGEEPEAFRVNDQYFDELHMVLALSGEGTEGDAG